MKVVNEANEKNDNEKPVNAELNHLIMKKQNNTEIDQNKDDINQNKVKEDIQYDINSRYI